MKKIRLIKDNKIQKWLRKPFYSSKYIYLNRWSLVHFSSGFILGVIFLYLYPVNYSYLVVFILLVLYEVFEQNLGYLFFYEDESTADLIWDLIIGMLGYTAYWVILNISI